VFAFRALPTIILISSFFTVLYLFGILQFVVRMMAKVMMRLMRTSGAETLSATANECVVFVTLTGEYKNILSPRAYILATYMMTGFANVASIGIQLGGFGGMAPSRRGGMARLDTRALLAGFVASLVNACLASMRL
jgi:nucleoside permease NupC